MRRFLARSSELEASNRSPSSADCITTMRGYRVSVHTGTSVEVICSQLKPLMSGALADELEQAHCHCIEYLAGITAEELFCDGELLPNTGHDLEAATAIAELICRSPSSIDAYLAFARVEATGLLTVHGAAVLAVAAALVKRRTLSGTEIDSIISTAFSSAVTEWLFNPRERL
jgi:hypothetical protein